MTRSIGERLREARGEASQTEFAKRIGVSQAYVAIIEKNRQLPSRAFLQKLNAQGINTEYVMYGRGAPHLNQSALVSAAPRVPEVFGEVGAMVPVVREGGMDEEEIRRRLVAELHRIWEESVTKHNREMLEIFSPRVTEFFKEGETRAIGRLMKPGRFGYRLLDFGYNIRAKMEGDKALKGSNLQRFALEDRLWKQLGKITGPEMESLRYVFAEEGDKTIEDWLAALDMLRFIFKAD